MLPTWSQALHFMSAKSPATPFISFYRHGCRITCGVEASWSVGRAKLRRIGHSQRFINFGVGRTGISKRSSLPEKFCLGRRTPRSYSFEGELPRIRPNYLHHDRDGHDIL